MRHVRGHDHGHRRLHARLALLVWRDREVGADAPERDGLPVCFARVHKCQAPRRRHGVRRSMQAPHGCRHCREHRVRQLPRRPSHGLGVDGTVVRDVLVLSDAQGADVPAQVGVRGSRPRTGVVRVVVPSDAGRRLARNEERLRDRGLREMFPNAADHDGGGAALPKARGRRRVQIPHLAPDLPPGIPRCCVLIFRPPRLAPHDLGDVTLALHLGNQFSHERRAGDELDIADVLEDEFVGQQVPLLAPGPGLPPDVAGHQPHLRGQWGVHHRCVQRSEGLRHPRDRGGARNRLPGHPHRWTLPGYLRLVMLEYHPVAVERVWRRLCGRRALSALVVLPPARSAFSRPYRVQGGDVAREIALLDLLGSQAQELDNCDLADGFPIHFHHGDVNVVVLQLVFLVRRRAAHSQLWPLVSRAENAMGHVLGGPGRAAVHRLRGHGEQAAGHCVADAARVATEDILGGPDHRPRVPLVLLVQRGGLVHQFAGPPSEDLRSPGVTARRLRAGRPRRRVLPLRGAHLFAGVGCLLSGAETHQKVSVCRVRQLELQVRLRCGGRGPVDAGLRGVLGGRDRRVQATAAAARPTPRGRRRRRRAWAAERGRHHA
mmetsp:Transcript_65305/g.199851  ORF Transcript_65305/g.199851 Transcript_65305/m.199851 type:complete len:603 (+) Transcript_65305:468-2276(+)